MRILLVAPAVFPVRRDLRYGGIEKLVYLFARELARRGEEVGVLAPTGSTLPVGVALLDGGPVGGFGISEMALLLAQRERILAEGWDVMHDFSHSHLAARALGALIPQVSMIWHDPFLAQTSVPLWNVAALSRWQAERFQRMGRQQARVLDVICGDPETYRPLCLPDERLGYVAVGRFHPTKGHLEAVHVARRAGVRLDVIGGLGPGDDATYQDAVALEANLGDVWLWGEVDDSAKAAMLGRAEGMLYLPQYPQGTGEAHSHKLIEGMLAGAPAYALDQGALGEVIDIGVTGHLFATAEEMAEALRAGDVTVTLDPEACRERAIARFSVENVVGAWVPIYHAVAGGARW